MPFLKILFFNTMIWNPAKTSLNLLRLLMDPKVMVFCLLRESLITLKSEKKHYLCSPKYLNYPKTCSKNTKGQKFFTVSGGLMESNNFKGVLTPQKEVTMWIAVEMNRSLFPRKTKNITVRMSWRWMLGIFGFKKFRKCKLIS